MNRKAPKLLLKTLNEPLPRIFTSTSLIMEITSNLGNPDLEYLRKQNYSDLHELGCDLIGNKLKSPWPRSAWRTRNRDKQIMTYIPSCQENKTYSHMMSTCNIMCQLNVRSQAAHSQDMTIQQITRAAEGVT